MELGSTEINLLDAFPYLPDMNGDCPIALCLKNEQNKTINLLLKAMSF